MIFRTVKKRFFSLTIIFTVLFHTALLSAHPHMFATSYVEFIWKGGSLQGARQTWEFDRFFSADIIQGYDLDHNGSFSPAETQDVYNEAFINVKEYAYFTFVRQGGNRTSPKKISDFSVAQKNGVVSYHFFVDLSAFTATQLYFAVYDYTFFCDFRYAEKNPVVFTGCPADIKPKYSIIENKKNPVYYDPLDTAGMSTVYTSWKPGLEIYYPKEIYLTY